MEFRITPDGIKNASIYTASLGYYYRNYWAALRPYLMPESDGNYKALYVEIRRYLKKTDNYLLLKLGLGNSPDEPFDCSKDYESFKLGDRKIVIGIKHVLSNTIMFEVDFGYDREEYNPDSFRDNWSGALKFKYLF